MKKDVIVFMRHIMEAVERIEDYTKHMSKEDFISAVQVQDAVIRRIEIIGEAAKNVPHDFRKKHSSLPWSEMVRTRDKLSHGYFGVDLELTWDIVKNDLPALKGKIKKILEEAENE